MNSKKRNKNRQNKAPNPTPPQKEEVSEPSSPLDVINAEIKSVIVEERVPNIVSENVTAEVKPTEETPKKPKRNRGKKKKDDDKTDKEDEVKTEEPIADYELQPVKDTLDDANIAPTARKKKNKNKTGQGHVQEEKKDELKIEKDDQLAEISGQPQEEPVVPKDESEQDIKSAKKKNKKKKNRNDSERSDKTEEVSCTSVFQKLLAEDVNVETIAQPATDKCSISYANVKEAEIGSQAKISPVTKVNETLQKDEVNRNKKKNKKDKKQPAVQDLPEERTKSSEIAVMENLDMPTNVSEVSSEVIVKEAPQVAIPSSSTADDNNIKLTTNISKYVDKKKGSGNLDKLVSEPKPASVEDMKDTEIQCTQEATASEMLPTHELDDVILVPLTEMTPDSHEEVKIKEGNGPIIGCEDKNETNISEQTIRRHEKNKSGKKSPKPRRPIELARTSDMPKEVIMPEEILPEASSSSKEQQEMKHDVKPDEKVEFKTEEKTEHQESKIKNIKVSKENEKRDKRKKSPKPLKVNEQSGTPTLDPVLPEASSKSSEHQEACSEETQLKCDDKLEMKSEVKQEDKNAQIQVADADKRKNKKKSAKSKIETAMSAQGSVFQTESTHIAASMSPAAITSLDIVQSKFEEITEIKLDPVVEKPAPQKEEMDSTQKPDSEKHQKRNKSPKPVESNIASSSKSTQESNQNKLKMEDIIIVQAEVVSDEKAKKDEAFFACEDSTTKKDIKKMEVKCDNEKSKRRKKSPKPPEREYKPESKDNSDKDCMLETQGEVQMPVTPMPQDMKLSPAVVAVELETPKVSSVPSPNEVTPDFIEYPRCSSEQLDNNNNMVIQEISHADPHLEVPEIPFIQSTNINSPELLIAESKTNEKTDLKSKVMEVNQDMEDLRISIERSLAELTSLQKTDRDAEKKLEEQKLENLGNTQKIENKQEIRPTEPQLDSDESVNPAIENKERIYSDEAVKSSQGPVCPARKDPKGKGKSKKKGKQESTAQNTTPQPPVPTAGTEMSTQSEDKNKDTKKTEQSSQAQEKEKQQKSETKGTKDDDLSVYENYGKNNQPSFEPIENFEDAMTSSVDDVNKTFEMIANEANPRLAGSINNPEINVIAPQEEEKGSRQEKQNPVSPPKNLLGHPDIPVPSSRTDYKKEKNKPPNYRQAKVKIKDANQVKIETSEKSIKSTESMKKVINFIKPDESICVTNQNDDYVYKYSFRKVFLQCSCHVCKKDLNQTRVPCSYCNLIFYCSQKHKDEDYSQHQALCFAVSTIVHLKDQKFIYADSRNVTGHNYRLLRMQMIVSCEKVLKRKLTAWEQEALLYPRMCADPSCREWRQGELMDCEGCRQISYCSEQPEHLPKSHSRWCKSYNLYRGLVKHQQTKGRLEPKLPTRVVDLSPLPDNINEVLATMYEEKIEMSDIEYAALTQLATAPLTALFCLQFRPNTNQGLTKKSSLTVHIVGAELQFEADVLNKWEVFLLHLMPHIEELRVVLVGPDLNPSNLPLELLGKIKHCDHCQRNKRRVVFGFQDKRTYHEYWASEDFKTPELVCAFNPSIQRSSAYNGKDTWPATINCIFKLKTPLVITSYSLSELTSDLLRIQECATVAYNVVCAPRNNSFSSVRPDRNFISDDEAPLLFKNHCVTVVCGV